MPAQVDRAPGFFALGIVLALAGNACVNVGTNLISYYHQLVDRAEEDGLLELELNEIKAGGGESDEYLAAVEQHSWLWKLGFVYVRRPIASPVGPV